jgi:predicted ATP-dependent endonuclease of OLD family
LLLAALQELATNDSMDKEAPSLFLAIEEPELFQHPGQARNLSAVLNQVADDKERSVQVGYATHSPYFVDAPRFDRVRRFGRRQIDGKPRINIRTATRTAVANRLQGVHPEEDIPKKIALSLRVALAEAVFASGVVLVEGHADAAVLRGFAERTNIALDALSVAIVPAPGKNDLPIALAVLNELGVPTFVVFDGDVRHKGTPKAANDERWNPVILGMVDEPKVPWPTTSFGKRVAVFEDRMEIYLSGECPDFIKLVESAKSEGAGKPEAYFEAALRTENVPTGISKILDVAQDLPNWEGGSV